MLENKLKVTRESTLPPQRLKTSELHPELRELLKHQNGTVKYSIRLLVRVAAHVTGKPIADIKADDLVSTDVSHYIRQHQSFANLRHRLPGVYRVLGGENPRRTWRDDCHPLLLEWMDKREWSQFAQGNARSGVSRFLIWLSEHYFLHVPAQGIPMTLVRREHVVRYRMHLMKRCATAAIQQPTAKRHLHFVLEWLRWLVDQQQIVDIDLTNISIRRSDSRERTLPSNLELVRLLEVLSQHPKWLPYLLFTLLLISTGARPSEVRTMRFSDIDTERKTVRLQSKQGPERFVPLPDSVWGMLQVYMENVHPAYEPQTFVLLSVSERPLGRSRVYSFYQEVCEAAHVSLDGLMAFRHRFATDCLENGVDLHTTRYILGHKTNSELTTYQHVGGHRLATCVDTALEDAPWERGSK